MMGLSGNGAARRLGVSGAAFWRKVHAGKIPRDKDGSFNLEKVRAAWIANTDLSHGRNAVNGEAKAGAKALGPEDAPAFGRVRLQREALRAALLRLEYQKRSGELISAAEVKAAAFTEARRFRDTVLAIPDRVSPVLAGIDDATEINRLLTEELTRALRELGGYREA